MTKRQEQWMEVGKAFEEGVAEYGLCNALGMVDGFSVGRVGRLRGAHGGRYVSYWFPPRNFKGWVRENDFIRATFAYFMAAMTDAERDEIVEGL